MFKKICFSLFLSLFAMSASASMFHGKAKGAVDSGSVVATAKVKSINWHPRVNVVGDLTAKQGVQVSTEVKGMVDQIYFQSGDVVKKGQLLVSLKHDELTAEVESDKAQVALTQHDYERYQKLFKQGIVSRQDADLDAAYTRAEQAKADLRRDQALLDQKLIYAPFSGRLGIRQVNIGQYLSPGDKIVSLQSVDPIYADFTVPENSLAGIKVGSMIELTVPANPDKRYQGKIIAISSLLNSDTRSLPMRAILDNHKSELLPGMYSKLAVLLPAKANVLTLPQTAIVYNSYGDSVYVVQAGKALEKRVTVGERFDSDIVIESGLKAGEDVVVAGQNKLHDGAVVKVDNTVVPK